MTGRISYSQVSQHSTRDSCWVILYGKVYDVTTFVDSHPGGAAVVLRLAGQDATEQYDPVHPPGTLEAHLAPSQCLGDVDVDSIPANGKQSSSNVTTDGITTIDDCLNLDDIEALATTKLSKRAWAYYFSASDDLVSKNFNARVYTKILLRPRIFINVIPCSVVTSILNDTCPLRVPFFVSPAAQARLAHPSGERGLASACGQKGVLQIISANASQTPEDIVSDAPPDQIFGWQLYVQADRSKSEAILKRINQLSSIQFIVLTLDAPVPGNRELDARVSGNGSKSGGIGKSLFAGTAADLTWSTTPQWLARNTSLPIFLKGIQTHEDAALASQLTHVKGIILSNHGGRALDTAPPAIHTLLEIRRYCPHVLQKLEVWVDGGIKRGTDVIKALALGARLVGIGRAPLYGLAAGGPAGVAKVFDILTDEIETGMRLLGARSVLDLGLQHVNARKVMRDIWDAYDDPSKQAKL